MFLVYRYIRTGHNLKKNSTPSFTQKEHFIGLDLVYDFLKDKKISPFIGLLLMTGVGSNYKYKYLDRNFTANTSILEKQHYYISSPFVSNLRLGCSFTIIENLKVNLSIENSLRIIKSVGNEINDIYLDKDKLMNELKSRPRETAIIDVVGLRLGLSYTIPFKKKTKTETP